MMLNNYRQGFKVAHSVRQIAGRSGDKISDKINAFKQVDFCGA